MDTSLKIDDNISIYELSGDTLLDRTEPGEHQISLPIKLSEILRLASIGEEDEGITVRRSPTSRRSLSIPGSVVFEGKDDGVKHKYMRIEIKGGGAYIPSDDILFPYHPDPELAKLGNRDSTKPIKRINTEGRITRFSTEPLLNFTYPLAFVEKDSAFPDIYVTDYLRSRGLRTRAVIAVKEIGDEDKISTSKGTLSLNEARDLNEKIKNPVVEAWAIRNPYRVGDIPVFIHELEGRTLRYAGVGTIVNTMYDNSKKRYFESFSPLTLGVRVGFEPMTEETQLEVKKLAQKEVGTMLIETINLGIHDEDARMSEICMKLKPMAQQLAGSEDKVLMEEILKAYMLVYAELLGEQFAILDSLDAYGVAQFNLQNISFAAEVVDLGHFIVNGKKMNSSGEWVEPSEEEKLKVGYKDHDHWYMVIDQLNVGWLALSVMIKEFARVEVLSGEGLEIFTNLVRNKFIDVFLEKRKFTDEELLELKDKSTILKHDMRFVTRGNRYIQSKIAYDFLQDGEITIMLDTLLKII